MTQADSFEWWGGVECTVARLGDGWRNQISELGLALDDAQLEAVRDMGVRRLRFPVLWETVAPQTPEQHDWRWHDSRLATLQRLGVSPIAGLLHHGSGPHYTHLLDPDFAPKLAAYAGAVARRYPWIDAYTPVNEPLTTARFSALYGHWYPHQREPRAFLRALVHQCRATVLAMREIRKVNPQAMLVQTDDLGKVFAPPALSYQAEHENERRWLGFDLLCGRVDTAHPLHGYLLAHGIGADELAFFLEGDGAPDILGINHYVTSDRYLDLDLTRCPPASHGGNGRVRYADVEAVRVATCAADLGWAARLREAWERYRRPLALTEVHLGCTREEQVRWLLGAAQAATTLRAEGVDLRALTAWSLFGAMDWSSLLTQRRGHYEPGAFDIRRSTTRPTLLGQAVTGLATRGRFDHPALPAPGWWQRAERLYPWSRDAVQPAAATRAAPLMITGASGTLGRAFARVCEQRGLAYRLVSRQEMDIADAGSVQRMLALHRPWAVVNAAGYVRVADAERDEAERAHCFRENSLGASTLAVACAEASVRLATFSSDLVFDGQLGRAYIESDATSPRCTYGQSKDEAERSVRQLLPEAIVVRTSAFFGPWDRYNFVHRLAGALSVGERVTADAQCVVSPTYVPDLVHAVLDLLLDSERGIWHMANHGSMTWYAWAQAAAEAIGLPSHLIDATATGPATTTALATERGQVLPTLDDALERYVRERELLS